MILVALTLLVIGIELAVFSVIVVVKFTLSSPVNEGEGGVSRAGLGVVVEKEGGSLNFLGARL